MFRYLQTAQKVLVWKFLILIHVEIPKIKLTQNYKILKNIFWIYSKTFIRLLLPEGG